MTICLVLVGSGYIVYNNSLNRNKITEEQTSKTDSNKPVSYIATFEIYTNGTKRIFTDPKYHNLNSKVFINSQDPKTIHIESSGITWMNFFSTLPMNLDKNCIITGTKQTFCTNSTQKLKFYINEIENPDALDEVIKPNDNLKVEYR